MVRGGYYRGAHRCWGSRTPVHTATLHTTTLACCRAKHCGDSPCNAGATAIAGTATATAVAVTATVAAAAVTTGGLFITLLLAIHLCSCSILLLASVCAVFPLMMVTKFETWRYIYRHLPCKRECSYPLRQCRGISARSFSLEQNTFLVKDGVRFLCLVVGIAIRAPCALLTEPTDLHARDLCRGW
jgi:hypothetical protein